MFSNVHFKLIIILPLQSFLKSTVLDSVHALAPDYLVEQCKAIDQNPPDGDHRRNGATCHIQLTLDLYHKLTPGLIAKYPLRDQPVHVARLDDIFAIVFRGDSVQFEIRNQPSGFNVTFPSKEDRESFVSGICGYYRLVKVHISLFDLVKAPLCI